VSGGWFGVAISAIRSAVVALLDSGRNKETFIEDLGRAMNADFIFETQVKGTRT
jgi:hypothetical protein